MIPPNNSYQQSDEPHDLQVSEADMEERFIEKLKSLKYTHRRVGMDEIKENDYNLNITRYVSTAEPEPIIDLGETHKAIVAADEDIQKMTAKHNAFLKELGLPLLP